MEQPSRPRSPLWMVVLACVLEEPMHPYRMQTLIKQRGKDQIANVAQRNSVYQAITALRRAGLIAVRETSREERRPERTVYEITDEGRRTFFAWLRTMLASPAREFPDFPAALSLLACLEPDDVRTQLEARMRPLETRLAELEQPPPPGLPRVLLLESECMAAIVRAELKWLQAVTADLRSGKLTWSEESLRRVAAEWNAKADPAAPPAASRKESPPASKGARRGPAKRATTSSRRR